MRAPLTGKRDYITRYGGQQANRGAVQAPTVIRSLTPGAG